MFKALFKLILWISLFVLVLLFFLNINRPEVIGQWFGKIVGGFQGVVK